MQTVLIAGATGYLGRYLCAEYRRRGWYVVALVRDKQKAKSIDADALIEAEATQPSDLSGVMDGVHLVVSALGITRQADGLSYRDVDFQANLNLLQEAVRAGVQRFGYIHVLNADRMRDVPLVAAKADFVDALRNAPLDSTVIAPSGYFSDMGDFLEMAKRGRVWLFGTGMHRINPIHGADLAHAAAQAIEDKVDWLNVGGPEIFTHNALAALAIKTVNGPERVVHLPDILRRIALAVLPAVTPRRIHGPAQFFLTAMAMDMVGDPHGTRRLSDAFRAQRTAEDKTP